MGVVFRVGVVGWGGWGWSSYVEGSTWLVGGRSGGGVEVLVGGGGGEGWMAGGGKEGGSCGRGSWWGGDVLVSEGCGRCVGWGLVGYFGGGRVVGGGGGVFGGG